MKLRLLDVALLALLALPGIAAAQSQEELRSLGYVSRSATPAEQLGVVKYDAARAFHGFTLFSNFGLCTTQLVSMEGRVLNSWKHGDCEAISSAKMLPNGELVTIERVKGKAQTAVVRYGWDGAVKQTIFLRGRDGSALNAHHDLHVTRDGKLLVLGEAPRQVTFRGKPRMVLDDRVVVIGPKGETLAEMSLVDALANATAFDAREPEFTYKINGVDTLDLLHTNSVQQFDDKRLAAKNRRLYAIGNLLVSMRQQDAIAIVDRGGKLVWSWGRGELSGPHHATLLANGNILLFDNGVARKSSRVLEVDPRTNKLVWQFRTPELFSESRGSAQRLPNGNTLLAESDRGVAYEVTPKGEIVWHYVNPEVDAQKRPATTVRMTRYSRDEIKQVLDAQRVQQAQKK